MATLLTSATQIFAVRSVRLGALVALFIAMLATLTWQAAQFVRDLNSQVPIAGTASSEMTKLNTDSKPSSSLLSLFGAKKNDIDVTAQTLEKLPESNLNLQVSAIFSMAQAEHSSVILEDGDRTMILKPGEEARPGIVVQAIDSHRITLKRNGKLEQISFKGFGEMPGDNSLGSPLPTALEVSAALTTSQNNDNEVIAQIPVSNPPAGSTAVDQNLPTAYQQYIQRKLAQNK
ncbi:hypothetical protein HP436_15140 [Pseudomonas sp. CrR14]|nr:hypothetical protein [Pseudomonas sp. CrR14]